MITIVYSHPYEKSFNYFILQSITKELTDLGRDYQVIDLYADGFNPAMTAKEYTLYGKGETDEPLVKQYEQMMLRSERVIFIFPSWWSMMPAMLKGFIDKVFLKGTFYDTTPEGSLMPNLSIDHTMVITTSESDSSVVAPFVEGHFIPLILNAVGMNNVKWFNCEHVSAASDERRKMFVEEVLKEIAN